MDNEDNEKGDSFDQFYVDNTSMFGHPYQELQDFFINLKKQGKVLDLGCGQGRDSLFLASIGYHMTAIDVSEVGVTQMLESARKMDLSINGIVGDIMDYKFNTTYDIILFDMILHSFDNADQLRLLRHYSNYLENGGLFCIIFPKDIDRNHFPDLLMKTKFNWKLQHEETITDVPIIDGMDEEEDFTFNMIIMEKNDGK